MTKEQIKAALLKAPSVTLTVAELRETFVSGKEARQWAAAHQLKVGNSSGGVIFEAL